MSKSSVPIDGAKNEYSNDEQEDATTTRMTWRMTELTRRLLEPMVTIMTRGSDYGSD